jgi:formylglycine-generating enzyme required for sulfatase activity
LNSEQEKLKIAVNLNVLEDSRFEGKSAMLEKGKKVGEYILLEKLGAGGFGEVWKAEKRTELSVSYFALKFFRPKDDDTIDLEIVKKEIQTWQNLSGLPNVISVIEANKFEDYVFIVSEFAEGGSLEKWLKANNGKANSLEEAVVITRHILQGLEGMHGEGFVHRDLKPANVLLKRNTFYLADFGISRQMKTHSKTNSTAGTYEFMPPEAFEKSPSVTPQTDIWAVGAILQVLLTGQLPFPQDEIPSLITAILMSEPEPLPASVPPALREIVKRSLQKKRGDRFQTAREMHEALKLNHAVQIAVNRHEAQTVENETKTQDARTADWPDNTIPQKQKKEFEERTENLVINPTEDWRALETEKERRRTDEAERLQFAKAENLRRQTEAEAARRREIEYKREQDEINRIAHDLKGSQQDQPDNPGSENKWLIGIGAGVLILIIIAAIATLNKINSGTNPPATPPANKASNISTNKPANVSSGSNSSNTLKNSLGMEFVKIPSSSFMMGSPMSEKDRKEDEIQHRVTLSKDFYLGKYEVTQAQWQAVMGGNPSKFKGDNLPVETVSWDDAQEFIKKLNAKGEGTYRLPTEAEWEYAARGGKDGEVFGIGDGKNLSSNQANFDGNTPYGNAAKGKYLGKTVDVGSYQVNGFGLYDMQGNVWEWCADWYGAYPDGNVTDPKGADSGSIRVFRGGGWSMNGSDLRSAFRNWWTPSYRIDSLGFRLVRN